MTELPPTSGVDYREPACSVVVSAIAVVTPIDQKQPQLAPVSASVKPPPMPPPLSSGPTAPVPAPTPVLQPPPLLPPPAPAPSPPMGEMILRGLPSPFAGLAKLLGGQYNLFG